MQLVLSGVVIMYNRTCSLSNPTGTEFSSEKKNDNNKIKSAVVIHFDFGKTLRMLLFKVKIFIRT